MSPKKFLSILTTTGCFLCVSGNAAFGAITYGAINNDSDFGFSATDIFTHKLDFGSSTTGALISGVQFVGYTPTTNAASANSFKYSVTSGNVTNSAGSDSFKPAVPELSAGYGLFYDLMYNGATTNGSPGTVDPPTPPVTAVPIGIATLELRDLTPGQQYDLRLYTRKWDGAGRSGIFSLLADGQTQTDNKTLNQNDAKTAGFTNSDQPYYISYTYTAGADGKATLSIDQKNTGNSWHLYGLTNEVIPEPSSALLVVGGLSTMAIRRRR